MSTDKEQGYMPGYKPTSIQFHELRNVENSAAYLLPKLTSLKQRKPNLSILDVGTGSGTIATSLASHVPDGHVTATDVSEEILSRARSLASGSVPHKNLNFQQANVFKLPFEDASFDVTHAHQVLFHIDKPVDALREMLRVTRPGGVVAVRECDVRTQFFYPELRGLAMMRDFHSSVQDASGGTSKAGRLLLSWALQAGATRDQVTASYDTAYWTTPEEKRGYATSMTSRMRDGEMGKKGIRLGFTTEADLAEMIKAWEEWMEAEDACMAMTCGCVLISKQ